MIGTIQQANKSKSGKTLSVQIDGTWYTSKNWELEQNINRRVIFEPSTQTFPDGTSIQWLNDYVFEEQSTTPSAQAMDRAMAGNIGAPSAEVGRQAAAIVAGQRTIPVKESVIGALALTKCISGTPAQVWEGFVYFYHQMENFDPTIPY